MRFAVFRELYHITGLARTLTYGSPDAAIRYEALAINAMVA